MEPLTFALHLNHCKIIFARVWGSFVFFQLTFSEGVVPNVCIFGTNSSPGIKPVTFWTEIPDTNLSTTNQWCSMNTMTSYAKFHKMKVIQYERDETHTTVSLVYNG